MHIIEIFDQQTFAVRDRNQTNILAIRKSNQKPQNQADWRTLSFYIERAQRERFNFPFHCLLPKSTKIFCFIENESCLFLEEENVHLVSYLGPSMLLETSVVCGRSTKFSALGKLHALPVHCLNQFSFRQSSNASPTRRRCPHFNVHITELTLKSSVIVVVPCC